MSTELLPIPPPPEASPPSALVPPPAGDPVLRLALINQLPAILNALARPLLAIAVLVAVVCGDAVTAAVLGAVLAKVSW